MTVALRQAREWYREDLVGQAIADSGASRHQLFLTSKLHPRHHGYESAAARIKQVHTLPGNSQGEACTRFCASCPSACSTLLTT